MDLGNKNKWIVASKLIWYVNAILICIFIVVAYVGHNINQKTIGCTYTEEEIIYRAVSVFLDDYPPKIAFSEGGVHKPAFPIYYDSVEDFLQKNPDCCSVIKGSELNDTVLVRLDFKISYRDKQDNLHTQEAGYSARFSPCM